MSSETQEQIALDSIVITDQVRKHMDDGSINGLSKSMRENGILAPIRVARLGNGKFRVIIGHRRVEAARKAGLTTIPAIIENGDLSEGDVLVRQLVENIQRENLTPVTTALGIDALMKAMNINAAQAAFKLGLAAGTVSKLLSLLSLPEELQRRIDAGEVPATTAYQLTKLDDPEAQNCLAAKVASGELTRDEVSNSIKTSKRKRRPRKPQPVRVTARLGNRQTVSVAAEALELDSFVSILQKLLAIAQQARTDGLNLQTMLKRVASAQAAAKPEVHAA